MNNYPKFDPMTGQPIQPNNVQPSVQPVVPNMVQPEVQNIPTNVMEPVQPVIEPKIEQVNVVEEPKVIENSSTTPEVQTNTQAQLENIPTVEQGKQEFINNAQAMNTEKKEEKKEGVNFWFVLIMFGVILAAIFFLFPFLLKYV